VEVITSSFFKPGFAAKMSNWLKVLPSIYFDNDSALCQEKIKSKQMCHAAPWLLPFFNNVVHVGKPICNTALAERPVAGWTARAVALNMVWLCSKLTVPSTFPRALEIRIAEN
jgi:hypothetical protein